MRRIHRSFPIDGEIWTAVCFGKITPNPAVQSEHHIDLHLERKRPSGPGIKPKSEFRTAMVGIGALPGTALGTQWVDGKVIGNQQGLQTRSGVVHFAEGATSFFGAYHRDELDQPLIPPFASPIPGEAAQSPYVVLRGSAALGDKVIIPCSEVARAWFLRTTSLARTLMSDPIDKAIANILDLNVPQRPGENAFCLQDGFGDADATVAALLRYSSLFKSRARELAISLVEGRQNNAAFLTAYPPVVGERRITALGYPFRTKGQSSFLVMRLLSVPLPDFDVPTESIVRYLREPGALGENGDETIGGRRHGYHYVSPKKPNPELGLGSSGEPNRSKSAINLEATVAEFEDAPAFNIVMPSGVAPGPLGGSSAPGESPTEYSTGGGVWSGEIGPARFRRTDDGAEGGESERKIAPAMPATFDNIEGVIPILEGNGWTVRTLSNDKRVKSVARTVRYEMPVGTSGKNWVYVGQHLRQLLVLEIEHRGYFYYLLDIQRRPGESYTLFFVTKRAASHPHQTRLSDSELESLVLDACVEKEGRWEADPERYAGTKLKHSHSTAAQLAEKLKVKIGEFRRVAAVQVSSPDEEEQFAG